jgi:hypothetical protein
MKRIAIKAIASMALIVGVAAALGGFLAAGSGTAYAGDLSGDKKTSIASPQSLFTVAPQGGPSWSGIGIGVYGSWIDGQTDTGPINIGSTGQSLGGELSGAVQMGHFVLEGFGDYGWVFGDLHDIGVNREAALGARFGYLVTNNVQLYALGARAWMDTDAKWINGWQYGGGAAIRFPNTPTELKLEWRHSMWDTSGIICTDATSDAVMAIVSFKLGPK